MPISYIQHRIYSHSQLLYFHAKPIYNYAKNIYKHYTQILLLYDIETNPGPKYNITIGYTNIRSLFSDTDNTLLIEVQDCKFNDMIKEFIYINNCDIIFLTETWLKDEEMNKYQLHIDGYRPPIYKNRPTIGGGLLIYYKENIKIDKLNNLENVDLEHLVVEATISNNIKFIFNLIYRAPTSENNITDLLINNFYDCYNYSIMNNYTGIYFLGDFNFPKITWNKSHLNNHTFYDAITQLGLFQLVNEPTRQKNILDLVLTDSPGFTSEITINPIIKNSDHNTIVFIINYIDRPITILPRKIYKYDQADWDKIRENLKNINWLENLYSCQNITQMVDFLQTLIYKEMDTNIPSFILSNTKRKHPLINYKIKKYIILQRRYNKKYKENPTDYNKMKYINTKNQLDKMFENARQNYYANISENLRHKNYSSRKFWNICNKLLKRKIKSNIGDIIHNKKIYKNDKDKVRIIGDYFAEQVTTDNGFYDNKVDYNDYFIHNNSKYDFPYVTKSLIDNIIKNLNINTANGPDNISNKFIKETKDSLLIPLEYIFNYSLIHGTYPNQWMISIGVLYIKKIHFIRKKIIDQFLYAII